LDATGLEQCVAGDDGLDVLDIALVEEGRVSVLEDHVFDVAGV